jgi:serine/threonine protein kinase
MSDPKSVIEPTAILPSGPGVKPPEPAETPGTNGSNGSGSAPTFLPVGTRLGIYRITGTVGKGGMGVVYRAHDDGLDRDVALKTIGSAHGSDPDFVRRFRAEAQAAARINHPNLVQVYYCGEEQGTLFFAMELVLGKSLGEVLQTSGPIPWPEAVRHTIHAARGLEAAAAHNVIHRDVKPENLLLSNQGTVKVADFGLAKRAAAGPDVSEGAGAHTAAGMIVGTPRYMSPEQAQGETLDFRADMYSLGATVFHLIAGKPVFDGVSAMKVCMKHIQDAPPELATAVPGVPQALSHAVGRMLAKRREDRHASYAALVQELETILAAAGNAATAYVPTPSPTPAPPASTPPPAAPSSSKALFTITKRPDGGVEVGVNCPVSGSIDDRMKALRAAAPLASSWKRLAADVTDFGQVVILFSLLSLLPWPHSPFIECLLTGAMVIAATHYLMRNGGTLGERLFETRLVAKNGGLPFHVAIGMGWGLTKAFPGIILVALVYWGPVTAAIGDKLRVIDSIVTLGVCSLLEQGLAFATGRSLRDRIFGTRVIDVSGIPEDETR